MCIDTRIQRPTYMWEPEKDWEREDHSLKLAEINEYWKAKVERQVANARIEGTEEFEYMAKLNQDILAGKTKWKRPRQPEQEFKFIPWTRGQKGTSEISKGGIDWFLYREKVVIPLIYPYILKVMEMNPGKKVYLHFFNTLIKS